MTRKTPSDGWRNEQKICPDRRHGRVKCRSTKSESFYGKSGRKYTLSSRAQEVLSTVLEDMIEDTLEDARKLAEDEGKAKVALEDVEMAMVNLCQRLQPQQIGSSLDTSVDCKRQNRYKLRRSSHEAQGAQNSEYKMPLRRKYVVNDLPEH